MLLKNAVENSIEFHDWPSQTIVLPGHSETISVLNTDAIKTEVTAWPCHVYKA